MSRNESRLCKLANLELSREEMIDHVSKAILDTIQAAGFTVNIAANKVTATNQETGEKFIVNYDEKFYDAVVELAQQIGIELEDG